MKSFTITKIKGNNKEIAEDVLAREVPFTLIANDKELVTLLCSPLDLKDLVRGFLFTSGLVKTKPQIKKIAIDRERWAAYVEVPGIQSEDLTFRRLYTSGCGRGTLFYNALDIAHRSRIVSDFKIKSSRINILMREFQKRSQGYLKTGAVHSAALADQRRILVFKEDIGRHNAIDKVIGHADWEEGFFKDKILMTSGRISSEVIFKARKCNIPLVVSKSAPTNQAVGLSREMSITLIGFARGNRMNVYSSEERVILEP